MTTFDDWHSRAIDSGGLRLHAFERDGEGDPVVLLHGAGANARAMAPVAAAFEGRPVLLLDMPGHGQSMTPPSWDLDDTALLVAHAAASRFGERAVTWAGHSWGGKVAGLVAAGDPSHCRGLVLLDPSPSAAVPVDLEDFLEQNFAAELAPRASRDEAVAAATSLAQWEPGDDESAAAAAHGLAPREDGTWALRPSRDDLLALCAAVLHTDATQRLAAASMVPTLLLVASESRPWQQFTNVAAYPQARVEEIAGHHWIHRGNRDAVVAAIRDWSGAAPR